MSNEATGAKRLKQSSDHMGRQLQQFDLQIKGLAKKMEELQGQKAEVEAAKKLTDEQLSKLPAAKKTAR